MRESRHPCETGEPQVPGSWVKVVLEPALLPASGGTSAPSLLSVSPPSFPGEHGTSLTSYPELFWRAGVEAVMEPTHSLPSGSHRPSHPCFGAAKKPVRQPICSSCLSKPGKFLRPIQWEHCQSLSRLSEASPLEASLHGCPPTHNCVCVHTHTGLCCPHTHPQLQSPSRS